MKMREKDKANDRESKSENLKKQIRQMTICHSNQAFETARDAHNCQEDILCKRMTSTTMEQNGKLKERQNRKEKKMNRESHEWK